MKFPLGVAVIPTSPIGRPVHSRVQPQWTGLIVLFGLRLELKRWHMNLAACDVGCCAANADRSHHVTIQCPYQILYCHIVHMEIWMMTICCAAHAYAPEPSLGNDPNATIHRREQSPPSLSEMRRNRSHAHGAA
jgi:hypothetical protein